MPVGAIFIALALVGPSPQSQPASASAPTVAATSPLLEVAWRQRAPARIELFELLADPPAVLITCDDGQALAYDALTGRPHWSTPVQLPPGVKWAGAVGEVAFLFDCHRVYALRCAPVTDAATPCLWTAGQPPPDANDPLTEPERLRCLAAARATPQGVLTAAVDGRVALLDLATGQPRWVAWLRLSESGTPIAQIEIQIRQDRAALAYQTRGAVRVAWAALSEGATGELRSRGLPDWPFYSVLGPQGLAGLSGESVWLTRPDGETQRSPLDAGARPMQSSITRVESGGTQDGGADVGALRQELWYCGRSGDLFRVRIDVAGPPAAERVLRLDEQRCRSILGSAAAYVLISGGADLVVVARESGAVLRRYAVAPNVSWVRAYCSDSEIVAWGLAPAPGDRSRMFAYVALIEDPVADAAATPLVRLYCVPTRDAADRADSFTPLERTHLLDRLLIGVVGRDLTAYRLPPRR